ncbi:MAG: heavy metal translocating P-type ATPase [Phycisphaerae bacterium]
MTSLAPQVISVPRTVGACDIVCTHCGLPVPAGLLVAKAAKQFCCHGCEAVYSLIHDQGLAKYYEFADRRATPPKEGDGKTFAEFDDEAFQNSFGRTIAPNERSIELYLDGVHCAACVWLVENLPKLCHGVLSARLEFRTSLVTIHWQCDAAPLSKIARVLAKIGYTPHAPLEINQREMRRAQDRKALIRIAVAGALAGNVMLLAFALYGEIAGDMDPQYYRLFRGLSCALGLLSVAWPGLVFLRGALSAVCARAAHLDIPIALGILAGAIAGLVNTIRNAGEVYFDSISVLIFLLLVGRWIQHRQQRRAAESVSLLFQLTPQTARIVREGSIVETPIAQIAINDVVEVRPTETIPVDGTVESGHSVVDRKLISGESNPVEIGVGEPAFAGTVNLESTLLIRVVKTGAETRIGKLMQLVERCSNEKAPVVQLVDRIAGGFVIVVLVLSAMTFALWWPSSPTAAIEHAVALLIVTCPCALGLATPLAVSVALGRAARCHILIKGGSALELLSRACTVLLDKTGTMTTGDISVGRVHGHLDAIAIATTLAGHSKHPVSRAIARYAEHPLQQICETPPIANVKEHVGSGLSGECNGQPVLLGSARLLDTHRVALPDALRRQDATLLADGLSPVWFARDGSAVALFGVGDTLKHDAATVVRDLQQCGMRVEIISGDNEQIVETVRRQTGVDRASGAQSPEDKLRYVQKKTKTGTTVMVGDGVNDAAALAATDVGIAVHGGAEASLAAADVYLSTASLSSLSDLFIGARRTMRVIRRALFLSLLYNALAAALAMTGFIHPILAAILMPASSLTVLAVAIFSRTFGVKRCQ